MRNGRKKEGGDKEKDRGRCNSKGEDEPGRENMRNKNEKKK